ncbi:4195_t:CDS:1, partial [Funneliformis geosporum]
FKKFSEVSKLLFSLYWLLSRIIIPGYFPLSLEVEGTGLTFI